MAPAPGCMADGQSCMGPGIIVLNPDRPVGLSVASHSTRNMLYNVFVTSDESRGCVNAYIYFATSPISKFLVLPKS